MTPSKEDEILVKKEDFELRKERGHFLFVHNSGQKAATDALGEAIWAALPGTADEIIRKVTSAWSASEDFVRDYLWIMRRAEVVQSAGEAEERAGNEEGRKTTKTGAGARPEKQAGEGSGEGESDLVSVVVITHNGAGHVVDCLSSLVRQSYKNVEIIAVDNASIDGTPDLIRSCFPGVRLLARPKNLHYSGGVNVGLRCARGKYVFVVNQDTEMADDCLRQLFLAMEEDEKIGAVVPMMKFFHLRGFINGLGNQIRNQGWGTDNFIGHIDVGQFADLKEVPSACFGAVFLSRKALDSIGLLDEGYGSFYEDVDWSFRCWMGGFRIVPQPKAVVYHKFGGSYLQRPKLKFVARNRQRLVLKLFRGRVMLGVFKRYLKEDMRNFAALLKKNDFEMALAYPEAYVSLGLGLAGTLRERRKAGKRKLPHLRELDVFRRNFGFYHAFDPQGFPRLDASILLGHYRWVMKKRAAVVILSEAKDLKDPRNTERDPSLRSG